MTDKGFFISNEILVGAYLPRDVSSHLSLAALCEGCSRAKVLERLIADYVAQKPIDNLMKKLAGDIVYTWEARRCRKNFAAFMAYLEKEVRPRLTRRRISDQHIVAVLKRAGSINAENKKSRLRQAE